MQEIGIESSTLQEVLNGQKTAEGRLGKPKFLKFRVGDTLSLREDFWEDGKIVKSVPNRCTVKINQLLYFETFQEMLSSIDFRTAIPDAESVDDALTIYRAFYSEAEEKEYGVVAILFELDR